MARRRSSFLTPQISGARTTTTKPQSKFSSTVSPPKPKVSNSRYESIVRRAKVQSKRGGDGHYRPGLKDAIAKAGGTLDKATGKVDFGTTTTKPKPVTPLKKLPWESAVGSVNLPKGDGSQRSFAAKPMKPRKRRRYGFTAT